MPTTLKRIVVFSLLFGFIFAPAFADAQRTAEQAKKDCQGQSELYGLRKIACYAGYNVDNNDANNPVIIIANVINSVLGFVGVIFLVLVIYGGVAWMTAGGNEERVKSARGILAGAAIGMVIIFLAFAISAFVFNELIEATGGS